MSKTVEDIGLIGAGLALALTGFGVVALPWAITVSATGLSTMASIGVAAGISGVFGLLQPLLNPQNTFVPGSQQNSQESAAYRRTVYGVQEVGGVLTYDSAPAGSANYQNQGPQINWRHQIYTIAAHEITSFGRGGKLMVVIDNIPTQLVLQGDGYYVPADLTNPYGGNNGVHIGFEFDLGSDTEASAFPLLSAACSDWVEGQSIQKGRAKVHVAMRYDCTADGSEVGGTPAYGDGNLHTSVPIYVSGRVPTFRFPLIGKPILDTRSPNGIGGYNVATNPSNPALIIYDYLTDTEYGMSADPSSINLDCVNAAANICEEEVVVYIGANGGSVSENLYSCDGMFDESQPRGDVLKGLVGSMAGWIVPPGDEWRIYAGAYYPPTQTITDDDLRDSIQGDFRISRRDTCNGVKGSFMPSYLPTNTTEAQPAAWHATDFPPYQGNGLQGHPNYIAEDGGQIIWKDITLAYTTSLWMAQRLAKIVLQTLRFQVSLRLACKLTAFQIQGADSITFIHQRWASLASPPPTVFFVTQPTLVFENENGAPTLGVDLLLRENDPSIYEFTAPSSPSDQGEYSQYGTLGVI
jgi:hypothetical protein